MAIQGGQCAAARTTPRWGRTAGLSQGFTWHTSPALERRMGSSISGWSEDQVRTLREEELEDHARQLSGLMDRARVTATRETEEGFVVVQWFQCNCNRNPTLGEFPSFPIFYNGAKSHPQYFSPSFPPKLSPYSEIHSKKI